MRRPRRIRTLFFLCNRQTASEISEAVCLFFARIMRIMLLAVFARGDTGLFFENAGEVALVVEAHSAGNFRDRHPGRTEQRLAALNAQAVDVLGERAAQ